MERIFNIEAAFEKLDYDAATDTWVFRFWAGVELAANGFWRLWQNGQVVYNAIDILSKRDLPYYVTDILQGEALDQIEVADDASYLTAKLTSGLVLEVFNDPPVDGGYEFVPKYGTRYRVLKDNSLVVL